MADIKYKNKIKAEAGVSLPAESTSKALQIDSSGNIQSSSVTTTELGYLSGTTSSIQSQFTGKISSTEKGAANGVATLDSGGKVPVAQLPSTVMEYQGSWDASSNTPTLADGTGDNGDVYRASVAGTQDLGSGPQTYGVGDLVIYNGTIWEKAPAADGVSSVNGMTGAVVVDAINELTGDVTAGPASGSESQASTVAKIQGVQIAGTTGDEFSAVVLSANPTFSGTISADTISATGPVTGSNLSGTNTGDQTITLTGDVTGSGTGSFAATIANDAVSNAKLANMATQTFKARNTAGTGDPEDVSAATATSMLSTFVGDSGSGGTKGLVPAPAAGDAAANKFLKADGTFATTPANFISAISDTASVDLTVSTGTLSAVVLPAGVDHNSLQNFVANKHIDHSAVQIATASATSGLAGGGDITTTRNLVVDIAGTTSVSAADNADLILIYDNSATALKSQTRANFLSGIPTSSAGDINETSFNMANNVSSPANVTGFAFANATVRSFRALVSIEIDATSDLFEQYQIDGIQKGASWDMSQFSVGDDSGVVFSITSAGQIQYQNSNYSGFVSGKIKFRAITTTF